MIFSTYHWGNNNKFFAKLLKFNYKFKVYKLIDKYKKCQNLLEFWDK